MSDGNTGLMRIGLQYPSLEAFAAAAGLTFAKGRMSVRSKRDLRIGQRLILAAVIPGQPAPIDIICEIIQQLPAKADGDFHVFALRWLNFTEKKLARLMGTTAAAPEPPPPNLAPTPEPPAAKPASKPAAKPTAKPAAKPAPQPPAPKPARAAATAADDGEEYIIDIDPVPGGAYPSFMDPSSVIIPDAPDPGPAK